MSKDAPPMPPVPLPKPFSPPDGARPVAADPLKGWPANEPIPAGRPTSLKYGDRVCLGEVYLIVTRFAKSTQESR